MTSGWQQVQTIFAHAIELKPEAREAYVRDAAGGDDELAAEILSLLSADTQGPPLTDPATPHDHDFGRRQQASNALKPGGRLGSFEIVALLGIGGMGEVYRARDLKLRRDVAIKVLPVTLANDPSRLGRFKREAQMLAALNHRNIGAIYGLHDEDTAPALVLELIEGPTLADRIAKGAIPQKEILLVAKQIAEALEAAHEQGIIHRDLKPANIKLRPDGEVKVLDFGIAKALDLRPGPGPAIESRTEATESLTAAGIVLGTAAYMSPEQIQGLQVDRRSDIWAFGVVLWEMITGRRLFRGATVFETVGLVLDTEPDWSKLPGNLPVSLRRLLRRSLEKDRKLRLDSAAVARLEIDEALSAPDTVIADSRWGHVLPWIAAATVAAALVVGIVQWRAGTAATSPEPLHVSAELGADVVLQRDFGPAVLLSPDGRTVVVATEATTVPAMLYVRPLEQLSATPLPATEDATSPFFSPDGQWIAFFARQKLQRVSVKGGAAITICDAPNGRGGTWGEDDVIVFAPNNDEYTTLMSVPASGGVPKALTTLGNGEMSHRWPQMLPRNRGVLYTASTSADWNEAQIMVQPLPSGAPKKIGPGFFGRYAPSGHLLYLRSGILYAAPFDIDRLEVTGPSASVVNNVVADPTTGGAQYSVSNAGTLVFLEGRGYSRAAAAVWMHRSGDATPLLSPPSDWANPQISPDGNQLALDISDGKQIDVWVEDLSTGQRSRLTFDPADDFKPVWTPDSQRIVFTSTRDGARNLYWQRADGTGDVQRLTSGPNAQAAASWHPNGRFLGFQEARAETGSDIFILPLERRGGSQWTVGAPRAFAAEAGNQAEPMFSPDGRWLAYTSNETGNAEVFVRSFAGRDGKWQVSSGGGRDATWSHVRPELLFFSTTQNRVMMAPFVATADSFRPEIPRVWSIIPVGRPVRSGRTFDLHRDGERVLIAPPETQKPDHMVMVLDFSEHLRQVAPPSQ